MKQGKANRVLPRERTGHSKHPLPTTQEKTLHMDITRWSTVKSDWLYSLKPKMEKLYTVSINKTGSWLGSDHELLIAKLRLKLKKLGETARLFRYDLNQIPNDYTVEVGNRFKGLDLIDSAWWPIDGGLWHCTGDREQDHPQEKEMQKSKMAVWGGLTNSCEKTRSKKQRRKGKIIHLNAEFQRIARRDKKVFLSYQCKEIEENNTLELLEISSRKLKIPGEHSWKDGLNKGEKWYGPNRSRRY